MCYCHDKRLRFSCSFVRLFSAISVVVLFFRPFRSKWPSFCISEKYSLFDRNFKNKNIPTLLRNTFSLLKPLFVFFSCRRKVALCQSGRMAHVSSFDQNALINLIMCRNSELMAGSQYPQTTRSLLQTGLLLFITLLLFLFSRVRDTISCVFLPRTVGANSVQLRHETKNPLQLKGHYQTPPHSRK